MLINACHNRSWSPWAAHLKDLFISQYTLFGFSFDPVIYRSLQKRKMPRLCRPPQRQEAFTYHPVSNKNTLFCLWALFAPFHDPFGNGFAVLNSHFCPQPAPWATFSWWFSSSTFPIFQRRVSKMLHSPSLHKIWDLYPKLGQSHRRSNEGLCTLIKQQEGLAREGQELHLLTASWIICTSKSLCAFCLFILPLTSFLKTFNSQALV